MRWRGGRESDNVEDRRGMPASGMVVGGGLGTLVIILIAVFLGIDPRPLLNQQGMQPAPEAQQQLPGPAGAEDELKTFVRVVLADTEDVWRAQFRQMGKTYQEPRLVLFSNQVESACGFASAAVGPFYCPGDAKVYLSTFRSLINCSGNSVPPASSPRRTSSLTRSGTTCRTCWGSPSASARCALA